MSGGSRPVLRGLIFDLDGTMVDNMRFHLGVWRELLAELGAGIRFEEFERRTPGRTNREILRMLLGDALSTEDVERWAERKEALYREAYGPHLRPIAGLDRLLEDARALGLRLAVATAAPARNVAFVLDGLGLRPRFDAIVGQEMVQRGKPEPDLFLLAAERIGLPPEQCLVFEDALTGLEAARRAGMRAVAIRTTLGPEELAGQSAVVLQIDDYTGLEARRLQDLW